MRGVYGGDPDGHAELEDVLEAAGFTVTDVPRPPVHVGCTRCGREVEAIRGVCIRCAAKDAPTHWEAEP